MIKCPKHPKYQGKRIPTCKKTKNCYCYEIWEAKQGNVELTWIVTPDGTQKLVEV